MMKQARALLCGGAVALSAVGCATWQRDLLAEIRQAPFVELCSSADMAVKITVTNETEITRLSKALPSWYFMVSREADPGAMGNGDTFVAVYYPDSSLKRMSDGQHRATPLFVDSKGFVGHMRGGMADMRLYGCRLPEYRDVVYSLCNTYGVTIPGEAVAARVGEGLPAASPPTREHGHWQP